MTTSVRPVHPLHICMPNIAPLWLDLGRFAYEVATAVAISSELTRESDLFVPDSRRAWTRLAVAVLIGSLGSVGMWSVVVALPVVQTEFGASRGTASLAFTLRDARIRFRRRADRQDHRPLRHRHRDRPWHRYSRPRLHPGGDVHVDLAVHPGAFRDRAFVLRHLRPADGGGLALVRPLPGAGGRHRRQRQLHRRHDLAAAGEFRHRAIRLAHQPYRDRALHGGGDDAGADRLADADGGGDAAQPCQRGAAAREPDGSPPIR